MLNVVVQYTARMSDEIHLHICSQFLQIKCWYILILNNDPIVN